VIAIASDGPIVQLLSRQLLAPTTFSVLK